VSDCIVKDFVTNNGDTSGATGNGIWVQPMSSAINFTIVNTVAVNDQWSGIAYGPPSGSPATNGVIDHVVTTNNGFAGVSVYTATTGEAVAINISHSIASNNNAAGILTSVSSVALIVDADEISNNGQGVNASGGSILISRSVITKNSGYGLGNYYSGIYTTRDNRIYANGNGNAFGGGISPTPVSTQ
jgi:hypothetical protein